MNFEVSTKGVIPENTITLKHSSLTKADEGKPVKVTSSNTVALASDGDLIFGVVQTVESNVATILIGGVTTLTYTGTAPSLNYASLVANATSGVKVDSSNQKRYRVLAVDTTTTKVTFILE